MGIVVVGAAFVDIKGYPLAQYIPGGRNVGRVYQVHGGVSRNVAEDIANIQLKPTYVSVLDYSGISADVLSRLQAHHVNTDYIRRTEDGLGTWLAIFDNHGDVTASISKRPDLKEIVNIFREQGDEIVRNADSIAVEIDMEMEVLEPIFDLAEKYGKQVYAVVSNMSIAMERRGLLSRTGCIVCNKQEAGMLFSENYEGIVPDKLAAIIREKIESADIPRMVVTMGAQGSVYAQLDGQSGWCPAHVVDVVDTTGAGDSFFVGIAIGLTYGKSLEQSCAIGARLAASTIASEENVCGRFSPKDLGF